MTLTIELNKFFPGNPYNSITIRHTPTHACGLPDHEEWVMETLTDEEGTADNRFYVRFLKECGREPLFAPGEKFWVNVENTIPEAIPTKEAIDEL